MMAISVLKGALVALVVAVPLWWLPVFLQREIPDLWLAAMTVPPVMLGGYVAGRGASRALLAGMLTGLVAMAFILATSLTADELWAVPVMMVVGGVFAALGAYVAALAGHAKARRRGMK